MEINTFVKPKMTSSNLNKIIRTNLNLNSKILSKNTNEIVNTCIGKLYKQIPLTFNNGLQEGKLMAVGKSENYGPVERFKKQERARQQTTAIKPLKTKGHVYDSQMFSNLMNMNKKPAALTPRKLLKYPAYKIFNSKRYCSSVSSSSGSILYRKEDKQPTTRNYHTPVRTTNITKAIPQRSSLIMATRHQHRSSNTDSLQRAMKVSGQIQKDLMAIDKLLKNRLKVIGKSPDTKTLATSATGKSKKQILKETPKQIKGISQTREIKKTTEPITEIVKPLKTQSLWNQTFLKSKNISDEENKPKLNINSNLHRLPEYLANLNVITKPNLNQSNIKESRKPLKNKANVAPSATYCLLQPKHFTTINYN